MAAWIAAPFGQPMVRPPGLAAPAPADANWRAGLSFSLTLRSGGHQGNVSLAPARASRPTKGRGPRPTRSPARSLGLERGPGG